MKRQRKSTTQRPHNEAGKSERSQASITDVPSHMLFQIFMVLPTKSIVMCKSVCKAWRAVISDREFASAHLSQAKQCVLIRKFPHSVNTASLYLLEDEELRSGYCACDDRDETCEHCQVSTLVKARLRTPLIYETCEVMNSCNGLLCLYTDQSRYRLMICNPVTGEFIHLPKGCNNPRDRSIFDSTVCGFGYSPERNEYKVIIIQDFEYDEVVFEIHTIGTKSWRKLDSWPTNLRNFDTGSVVYLDGSLHWIVYIGRERSLLTFDLNTERIRVHSLPILDHLFLDGVSLMVQGGRLYMFDNSDNRTQMHIWAAMETGYPSHFTQLFSVDFGDHHCEDLLCCENDEVAVICDNRNEQLIYYDRLQGLKFKAVYFRDFGSDLETITYTPSFVSLKDTFRAGNVEVLEIRRRRGERGKREDKETGPLLLGGKRH